VSDSSTHETERTRLRASIAIVVAGLGALAVAIGIGRFAFTPILPMMQEDAGVSVAEGGWLASANYVGYLAGSLAAIRMRMRPALAVRAGLAGIAVSTLAMSLEQPFASWAILRALAGGASAWVLIFGSAWCLERLAALGRPAFRGGVFAGVGVGVTIAGVACIVLMRSGASSVQAWIAIGALSAAVTALIWRTFDPLTTPARRAPAGTPAQARRFDAESVRLIACYGVFGFGYIIPSTFLPVMAKQAIADPAVFGWSWPAYGIAAALSTLAAAAVAGRAGNRGLWIASQWVLAAGVVLPVVWPRIAGIIVAAMLVGGTFMVITMVAIQEGRDYAGEHSTPLVAAMTSAFAAGQILGPLAVSVLVEAGGGMDAALVLAAVLLAASALPLVRFGTR